MEAHYRVFGDIHSIWVITLTLLEMVKSFYFGFLNVCISLAEYVTHYFVDDYSSKEKLQTTTTRFNSV